MYRTRWSGQRYINKLIINSIVMYVLKKSGIVGCDHFCNQKLIYLKYLVYIVNVAVWREIEAGGHRYKKLNIGTGCSM